MSLKIDNHYHANDIVKKLKAAEEEGLPVYPAQGPCGGCDLVIPVKKDPINVSALIESLGNAAKENSPVYPAEGPCGGCDLVVKR